jgi:acyl-coenzyme A synthetase/AMP-(fatty) acid ligase
VIEQPELHIGADTRFEASRAVFHQDGTTVSAAELNAQAEVLARDLRLLDGGRVALSSSKATVVVATLFACQKADCEILLSRQSLEPKSPFCAELGVSALIDDRLQITPLAFEARVPRAGFGVLLATSGTTGIPKVARHSLERLMGRIRIGKAGNEPVRWLLTYHPASFAGMQVLLTVLRSHAELVALSLSSAAQFAEAMLRYRPTHVSGTPTFWRAVLLALGPGLNTLPVAQVTLGGEAVDQTTLDRLRTAFPTASLTHIYASTEAGALFAVRDGRAGFPTAWLEASVDDVRLRVRDDLLEVWSPRAMERLVTSIAQPVRTADGWICTGDRVAVTEDRVMFVGRADAWINVGGSKVFPEEVEAVLLQVHGVADVRVFGAANPITGRIVAAEVVAERGVDTPTLRDALMAHARAVLEPYKLPRIVSFIDRISASAVGKKQRAP